MTKRVGVDDVRRCREQHLALRERFGNEAELEMFEVAQPAVNELAAGGARCTAEIPALDQQHREAAAGCVARDADAVDSAPDYEHVYGIRQTGWHALKHSV